MTSKAIVGPCNRYNTLTEAAEKGRKKPRMTETRLLKKRLLAAFDDLGGLKGLVGWAKKKNANRMFLYGHIFRLIPVERQVSGENPKVAIQIISAVPRPALPAPDQVEQIESVMVDSQDMLPGETIVKVNGKRFRKRRAV